MKFKQAVAPPPHPPSLAPRPQPAAHIHGFLWDLEVVIKYEQLTVPCHLCIPPLCLPLKHTIRAYKLWGLCPREVVPLERLMVLVSASAWQQPFVAPVSYKLHNPGMKAPAPMSCACRALTSSYWRKAPYPILASIACAQVQTITKHLPRP